MTTPSKEPSSSQHQSTTTLQATAFHDDGYIHLPSLLTSPVFLSQLHTECLDIFHATLDWLYVSGAAEFVESVRLRDGAAENIDNDDDTKEEEEASDGIPIRSVAADSSAPKSSDSSSGGGNSNKNSCRYYEYPIKQGLKNGYRELVMRSDGRYELALLIDDDSRRSARKRSDVAKKDDGCNNYEKQQKQEADGSRMKGEQNDGCYSDSYNGKRLMTVELIEQAKRQFLTDANNNAKNGEPLCNNNMMEEECRGNETTTTATVKQMAAASKRTGSKTSTSCLQQILRWIQQYQVIKMDDDDDNSINEKNDNTTQDEEQNTKEHIMDETNFQSFMELVSAIFQTDTNNHPQHQQQQQQHNSNDFYLCNLSLLISTPGSTTQPWHADGCHTSLTTHLPSHVFNVFIQIGRAHV